jgi:ubiquinone/menaquinone biosynthesis C-methylase UbiE
MKPNVLASPPSDAQPTSLSRLIATEEARIEQAYARRRQQGRDRRASWSEPAHVYAAQDRERRVLASLARVGVRLPVARVLEVGCGTGAWIRDLVKWGVPPEHIWAVDLLSDAIAETRHRCAASVHVERCSAASLPFPAGSFDLVLQATMFTSIVEPTVRRAVAAEMLRVLAANGSILWYDFHFKSPWNQDVRAVRRTEITDLFPGCRITLQRVSLAPPLSRWIAPRSHALWLLLGSIPWLCTHYLGTIRKPEAN